MAKPSVKWLKMAELYKRFAKDWNHICDFSDKSAEEMFDYESVGKGDLSINIFKQNDSKYNGFAVGKHWMDATVGMWNEDLASGEKGPFLFIEELLADGFPMWFLEKVCLPKAISQYKSRKELLQCH